MPRLPRGHADICPNDLNFSDAQIAHSISIGKYLEQNEAIISTHLENRLDRKRRTNLKPGNTLYFPSCFCQTREIKQIRMWSVSIGEVNIIIILFAQPFQ